MDEEQKLLDLPFSMPIDDILKHPRGLILAGRVQTGSAKKGDAILIVGEEASIEAHIVAFEGFIRDPNSWVAMPGDNTYIQVGAINRDAIEVGMIVLGL